VEIGEIFEKKNVDDTIAAEEWCVMSDLCLVANLLKSYLPGKGEPQINKCGPWWGAGHCTPLL